MSPELSLIMPAKNAGSFIASAVEAVQKLKFRDWELIIVNDHSDDATPQIIRDHAAKDSRIIGIENPGEGKVAALNAGFTKSRGRIIKCVDADDCLIEPFSDLLLNFGRSDAVINDCQITNSELKILSTYKLNPKIISASYETVAGNLISIPRHLWTVTRPIACKIFPMPTTIPFEDVWFSLRIKEHAKSIKYFRGPCYLYRQHDTQTYGGILNYSRSIIEFRANRMLKLIHALELIQHQNAEFKHINFSKIKEFYHQLANKESSYVRLGSASLFFRLILFRYFRPLLPTLTRIKWAIDQQKMKLQH